MKDEKSAAKFHYIKTVSGKVVAQSICVSSGIGILAGGSSIPLISECKGSDHHCVVYSYSAGGTTIVSSCIVKVRCRNENFDP